MKKRGVYAIVNIVSNKMYIGSSKNITKRLCDHKRDLKKGTHHNQDLQKDWDLSEGFNFKAKLLEAVPEDINLFERERFYIESNTDLYNLHIPSNKGGSTHQPESVREKIRKVCAQDVINAPEKYIQARKKSSNTIKRMIAENNPTVGIGKKRAVVLYNETSSYTFNSIKESAAFINVTVSRINECLAGFKLKERGAIRKVNSIKGYKCKYLEN